MSTASIIFAGGGSGGHLSPGLAIHERLMEIAPSSGAHFVCSSRPIDAAMLGEAGVEFTPLPAAPPSLRPAGLLRFARGHRRSKAIVQRLITDQDVRHVVTLGGFVAPAAVSAAHAAGVPVLVVNLDSPPGRANRWMARRASQVVSAIHVADAPAFSRHVVGMPVRRRALAPGDAAFCRARLGLEPGIPTLLVTGASQGATSVNQFMATLGRESRSIFEGWQVLHLTGHGADEPVRAAYACGGVRAMVLPFLNEMGLAWGAAALAISRAGASSVAEVAHNAVPTIFLPYPYHADMHQRHNAQPLVDAGGAMMLNDEIDPKANILSIAPILSRLMQDQPMRQAMASALRHLSWPDAAMTIARMVSAGSGAEA